MRYNRHYWRAVAEITNCPQPAWVWKLGFSPAASRILEALREAPRTSDDLSEICGYSDRTLPCVMSALMRLGQVEQRTQSRRESNLWYVRGAVQDADR